MPPEYGTCGEIISTLGRSHEEERLLISLMKKRASKYLIPKRYLFSLLSFTACCLAVSYNMNLSIAIVSMLNKSSETANGTSFKEIMPANNATVKEVLTAQNSTYKEIVAAKNATEELKFDWNADIESLALGAVYYGQMVSFIPGGRMAELYGGKRMLLCCMFLAAVATVVSPMAATWSPYAFIVDRVLVGVGTGPIIPILFYMMARWIPESERSFHASFILSGYGVGSFLAVIVSGALCGTTVLHGWPLVFYAGGGCGFLWVILCIFAMCETPDHHPSISDEEFVYIMSGVGSSRKERIPHIPWKDMALSVPLWALAIGFFGQFWLLGFFSTVHALYMGTVLNLPIVQNGVLSCFPHLLRAFATCIASYPVDILLKKKLVSVGFVRKGATVINSLVSCAAFFGITLVGRNVSASTLLFILGGVLGEFVTFGVCMACIDIAPCLSGTVSGIINIVGVFPFFVIPALVGWITNYENSIEQWRKVFYSSIAVVLASTFIFVIFGDLRPQPWGVSQNSTKKSERDYEEIINDSDDVTTPPKKIEDDLVY